MPRATPRQPRGSAVPARRRLLDAAEELFYRDGIAGTGVDAVLTRAGVAIGSLYRNFAGKDGLTVAYLDDRQARWTACWDDAVATATTPEGRVLAVFDALEGWAAQEGASRGCADLAALVSLPPGHPAAVAALRHKAELAARLRALVEEAVPAGAVDATTDQVVLAYDGALARLAVGGPAPGPEDPLEAARAVVRGSLRSAAAP
ncbi:TetR/AcrR family transcriptional regulator [Phycicoccus sp. CSK15P-2]|uniref:TetR/AcrR family transcriptional regulator n=1 Tax=Phycicoccus sp. CSK15P-2 TaxID=2807627 RepID=UPI00194DC953|nr:TetR/AcrR family transcriptional regulator [Phycicoccus sp. CSK15P-2]MBM6405284.1 TetR/AcrR family transcriptional regulator [Phycicoccus sp. CSK15P-2]